MLIGNGTGIMIGIDHSGFRNQELKIGILLLQPSDLADPREGLCFFRTDGLASPQLRFKVFPCDWGRDDQV